MKFTQILPFAALISILSATSCSQTDTPQPEPKADICFNIVHADNTYSLIGSAADFYSDSDIVCNDYINLVIPSRIQNNDISALTDSILSLATDTIVRSADPQSAVAEWISKTAAQSGYKTQAHAPSKQNVDGFDHVNGFVVSLTDNTLVYCINASMYAPHAANGMTTRSYINYMITGGGRMLSLSDLFTPEGLKELPATIAERAADMAQYAGMVDIDDLPQGGNYYISSEGEIVFSYYPMEVGPHVLGTVEIPLYPSEVLDYLTPLAIDIFGLQDLVE